MNKYSIILPVFNGGEYIKECVNSILDQTLEEFNLIVLNNNSSDGTLQWLEQLNDNRIIIYTSDKTLSIEQNWARIKDIPRNEFMTMIGHDDVLYPTYLQEMDRLINEHPAASLYQAHYRYIDQDGEFVRNCLPMDEMQYAHEFLACQMCRTIDSSGTGYMMRSGHYDQVGGMPANYPNLIFADYELWVRLTLLGYKATTVKECFSYRIHDNLSRTTNGMLYQKAFGVYIDFMQSIMDTNEGMQVTINRYGKEMLLYFCESLSHRLLKTPVTQRSLKVDDFIRLCESYAGKIIPGQPFQPLKRFRIKIANQLDQSAIGRAIFNLYKRMT